MLGKFDGRAAASHRSEFRGLGGHQGRPGGEGGPHRPLAETSGWVRPASRVPLHPGQQRELRLFLQTNVESLNPAAQEGRCNVGDLGFTMTDHERVVYPSEG